MENGREQHQQVMWGPNKTQVLFVENSVAVVATDVGICMYVNGEASTETVEAASMFVEEVVVGIDSDIVSAVDMMHHQFAILLLQCQSKIVYNEKSRHLPQVSIRLRTKVSLRLLATCVDSKL